VSTNDFETALIKMRNGIFNLLRAFEVDLTKEMPYHETLTVFWMQTVYNFINGKSNYTIVEIINEIIVKFDKNYPARFYSHKVLFSDKARERYIPGDIETL